MPVIVVRGVWQRVATIQLVDTQLAIIPMSQGTALHDLGPSSFTHFLSAPEEVLANIVFHTVYDDDDYWGDTEVADVDWNGPSSTMLRLNLTATVLLASKRFYHLGVDVLWYNIVISSPRSLATVARLCLTGGIMRTALSLATKTRRLELHLAAGYDPSFVMAILCCMSGLDIFVLRSYASPIDKLYEISPYVHTGLFSLESEGHLGSKQSSQISLGVGAISRSSFMRTASLKIQLTEPRPCRVSYTIALEVHTNTYISILVHGKLIDNTYAGPEERERPGLLQYGTYFLFRLLGVKPGWRRLLRGAFSRTLTRLLGRDCYKDVIRKGADVNVIMLTSLKSELISVSPRRVVTSLYGVSAPPESLPSGKAMNVTLASTRSPSLNTAGSADSKLQRNDYFRELKSNIHSLWGAVVSLTPNSILNNIVEGAYEVDIPCFL